MDDDSKKEIEQLRIDLTAVEKKLKRLGYKNQSKIKQTQYVLMGGFTAVLLMILNLNLKAEELLNFIDKASDNYLKIAAVVIGVGTGAAAIQVKEPSDDDDDE